MSIFPGDCDPGEKSHSHEGGPNGVPSGASSMDSASCSESQSCRVWSRGSKGRCSAEIWVGGAGSCQALSVGGTPQHLQQHPVLSTLPPRGSPQALTLVHGAGFQGVLFDLWGLFSPLLDWQLSHTTSDRSQDYCTVPGMADDGS